MMALFSQFVFLHLKCTFVIVLHTNSLNLALIMLQQRETK